MFLKKSVIIIKKIYILLLLKFFWKFLENIFQNFPKEFQLQKKKNVFL